MLHEDILVRTGLSSDEARVYGALLDGGPQGAGDLLKRLSGVKRGLLYKVLDRLVDRGLVTEKKGAGPAQFVPQPPDMLLLLAEEREATFRHSREALKNALPDLKAKYNLSTERPIIRFFEGVEGLRKMYEDKLEAGIKELHFIRTARAETYRETFGAWFPHYLKRQRAAGVKAYALTVDDEFTNHDPAVDAARNMIRTWLRPQDYTAPVEVDAYGDRVAIFVFGKEFFGIIIESAPLAQSIREILILADRGAKTVEVTHDHPPVAAKEVQRRKRELKESS